MLVAQRQEYEELYYPPAIEKQSQPVSRPKKIVKPKVKAGKRLLHLAVVMIGLVYVLLP